MSGCRITHCSSQKLAIVQTQSYTEQRKHQSRTTILEKKIWKVSWFFKEIKTLLCKFQNQTFWRNHDHSITKKNISFSMPVQKGINPSANHPYQRDSKESRDNNKWIFIYSWNLLQLTENETQTWRCTQSMKKKDYAKDWEECVRFGSRRYRLDLNGLYYHLPMTGERKWYEPCFNYNMLLGCSLLTLNYLSLNL